MSLFTAGVIINCIAILMIIANAVYDASTLSYAARSNATLNLIGFALAFIVVIAYSIKNSGKLSTANIVLWISAGPLSIFLGFTALYLIIVLITKPDWR